MSLRRSFRLAALVTGMVLGLALAGNSVHAVEPPPGSRNFRAPTGVPNYFSNESGSFQGGANAPARLPVAVIAAPAFAAPPPSSDSVAPARQMARQRPGQRASGKRAVKNAGKDAARGRQRIKLARGKAIPSRHAAQASAPRRGTTARASARSASGKSVASRGRAAPGPVMASQGKHAARTGR